MAMTTENDALAAIRLCMAHGEHLFSPPPLTLLQNPLSALLQWEVDLLAEPAHDEQSKLPSLTKALKTWLAGTELLQVCARLRADDADAIDDARHHLKSACDLAAAADTSEVWCAIQSVRSYFASLGYSAGY